MLRMIWAKCLRNFWVCHFSTNDCHNRLSPLQILSCSPLCATLSCSHRLEPLLIVLPSSLTSCQTPRTPSIVLLLRWRMCNHVRFTCVSGSTSLTLNISGPDLKSRIDEFIIHRRSEMRAKEAESRMDES